MAFKIFGGAPQSKEEKQAAYSPSRLQVSWREAGDTSARNPVALTRKGYMQNAVVFRAVQMIAEAASALKLNLQDSEMRYDAHPVLSLIEAPNDTQSGPAFFEALYGHYLLSGQAYVEARYNDEGQIDALYLLRPERVRVVLGKDGWPSAYEYKVGAHKTIYPIRGEDTAVLQIRSFHPQDDHYGLSPILAAANAIDVHNAAGHWSKSLLENAARPSGAIVYRGTDGMGHLSQTQFKRLQEEILDYHQGARNAGRPMLLEGGLDWKPMGFSPSDMEFHRTKEMASREIALAFGVPPMLLGISGDNTYANYQEANRAFYRLTVLPLAERILSSLNAWLLKNDKAQLYINLETLPAFAKDREADWRRISDADFLTPNEKRKLLGFPTNEEVINE